MGKNEIAVKIKNARLAAGMTQAEAARRLGCTYQAISNYERGTSRIEVDILVKLCDIYGISINDVLDVEDSTSINTLPKIKESTSIPDAAFKFAKRYENLDSFGKAAVLAVLEEEENRIEAQAKFDALASENESKVINLFLDPSAAGMALGMTDSSCEPYELKPDDPQGAAYAVRLQGDSMSPHFPDGSIVFVNHDQMRDGDIGIFCVDGSTVCKQWHYDPVLNITYLFSLNRKREDADLVITGSSGRSLVWQGRVITKRRYPLPHER